MVQSTIYARVNGYVAKWVADIGDHVSKGQVLATIDTPELDAELPPPGRSCRRPRRRYWPAPGRRRAGADDTRTMARLAEWRGIGSGAGAEAR